MFWKECGNKSVAASKAHCVELGAIALAFMGNALGLEAQDIDLNCWTSEVSRIRR